MKWGMRHILLLLLLLSFLIVGQLAAQIANLRILKINSDEFPTIRVIFDARNRNGGPIENITSEQLTLNEDDQAQQVTEITSYVNPERPISLALVIDVSPSAQGQPLENAKQAANNLLDQLKEKDRMAFIIVPTEVNIDELIPDREVNFTTDRNAVRNAIDLLELAPDNTALYDAMLKTVRLTANENVANRAIILITDGVDNQVSRVATADDPIIEANRNSIPIFTIGLGEPRDLGYLQRVAVRTGGTFKETNNPEELTPLFTNILELLKKEYTLAYQSALEAGASGKHNISISTRLEGLLVNESGTFILGAGAAEPPVEPTVTATEEVTGTETGGTPVAAAEEEEVTEEPTEGSEDATGDTDTDTESNWVKDNLLLVIGGAGVLLLLIIGLIAFLMKRNRKKDQEEDWSANPSTVQAVSPYASPSQEPAPQEQNWASAAPSSPSGSDWNPQIGSYHNYPSSHGPKTMDDRGIFPQTSYVDPTSPTGQSGTVPTNSISSVPSTPAIPSTNLSDQSASSGPKKTVIFNRAQAQKKPIPYLIRVDNNQRFNLESDRIFIGRSPDNGIYLNDETVSGKHAVIVKQDDQVQIQDIGSTNGTFINEEEVKGRKVLKEGDTVRFGKVEMTFHTGEDASTP